MTTDTFAKEVAVRSQPAGSIDPHRRHRQGRGHDSSEHGDDAEFHHHRRRGSARAPLQRALTQAVKQSFNRISVDGDTSTNDTVILLANGAGRRAAPIGREFQEALNFVCLELAKMIVRDGEGVSKFVTVNVRGAASDRDAESRRAPSRIRCW